MPTETTPNKPRTVTTGVRKLLKLGHSRAITLPAAWLRNNTGHDTSFLDYRITNLGELVIEPAAGAPHQR